MTQLSVLLLAIALLGACGGSPATNDASTRTDSGNDAASTEEDAAIGEDAAAEEDAASGEDAAITVDAGEATSSPMGTDCTDTCPSFEGREYVCTFLPGFRTDVGFCSLACTSGDPTACVDTEPGEVYCNDDVGRCIIGCPFAGCPHGMECTFDFADQPACEPVP